MRKEEVPVISFPNAKKWADWLSKNHSSSPGMMMKIAKKGAAVKSVSYKEAVDVALCYGWIDAVKKGFDDSWWLQKFTPRRPNGVWSKVNKERAEQLMREGKMHAAGRAAIEAARKNGRWDSAYSPQGNAPVPEDLRKELENRPKASAFFSTLNSVNRYAILHRLETAKKTATRAKRLVKFLDMLEKGEKLHP